MYWSPLRLFERWPGFIIVCPTHRVKNKHVSVLSELDHNGLKIGISPEHFRSLATGLLFEQLNAQCEGAMAVNRQTRIVWILLDRARDLRPLMGKFNRLQKQLHETERALHQAAPFPLFDWQLHRQRYRSDRDQTAGPSCGQARRNRVAVWRDRHWQGVARTGYPQPVAAGQCLRVPSLRERIEDIPALVEAMLEAIALRCDGPPLELSDDAIDLLSEQPWPGNVRQLRNLLERAQLAADDRPLSAADIAPLLGDAVAAPRSFSGQSAPLVDSGPVAIAREASIEPLADSIARVERAALISALEACAGNRSLTANRLGISRASLYVKLQHYGIER